MNKNTIWWKLSYVTYWLSILGLLGGLAVRIPEWKPPTFVLIAILIVGYLPNLYLSSFSLWHWKYRYRGLQPTAWAVVFPLFWCVLPSLFYFERHIKMDRENKKQYANSELPFEPIPKRYNTLRSVFSVIGGALVGWAAFAISLTFITTWLIFRKCDHVVAHNVGKVLTAADVEAFHVMHTMYQILAGVMCAITLCCAIGSVLLVMSGSIRWRLREQNERTMSNQSA